MKKLLNQAILAAGLLAACADEGADRIETVTKLKILAVRADHPDLLPGETTRVEVLVAAPGAVTVTTLIVPMGNAAGATFNFAAGSSEPAAPVDRITASATAPGRGSVFYRAPLNAGAYTLGVFAAEGTPAPESEETLKALKTMRVRSPGEAVNENPEIVSLAATKRWRIVGDERRSVAVEGFRLEPAEVVRIAGRVTDETPERVSLVWWVSHGRLEDYGRYDADFVAPEKPAIVTVIALALDRIGGAAWRIQDLAVGAAKLTPDVPGAHHLLASSGGRLVWIAFSDAASRDRVIRAMEHGDPAYVEAETVRDAGARLGWRVTQVKPLDAPPAGAKPVTAEGVSEMGPVVLQIDGFVAETK